MDSESCKPHIFFFPFMAHGHMIPAVDMAKLFASRGLKATIVTTPLNEPLISKPIQRSQNLGLEIDIKILKFPTIEDGLPEGCENLDFITSQNMGWDMLTKFFTATALFREPLEQLLSDCRPECLVADMFFPWATDAAAKFGIPRLVFHGTSFFALCTTMCIALYQPHKTVASDSELFLVPNLPGDIKLSQKQLPIFANEDAEDYFTKIMKATRESEVKSYGVVVNSFYELEPTYADYYRKVLGRRAWHVGPVSLCNRETEEKACRGKEASIGLEFIWVVRRNKSSEEEDKEDWLPEGFEERIGERGLIIRGWAPQLLILDHEAVGGFVTHCGWNSILEGITSGVPMVTWPAAAEQFYNEKLVTQILKIGIGVGAQQWNMYGHGIMSESIEKAVTQIMKGSEAEEMRRKAKALSKMARMAVEEGGSSCSHLNALTEELIFNLH